MTQVVIVCASGKRWPAKTCPSQGTPFGCGSFVAEMGGTPAHVLFWKREPENTEGR
jgi:hypothetical protein